MLAARHRLHRSGEFSAATRRGRRSGTRTVVVHLVTDGGQEHPPRVGFVVSKAVGNSVVRHRVTRRLRAQVAARLDRLPVDSWTVVRALPAAAEAGSVELGADLDRALARVLR